MFKRFTKRENIISSAQVKSSIQRNIRRNIAEQYPLLESEMDVFFPRKAPIHVTKCSNHINLVACQNKLLFFNIRDGPYFPHLRILHQYPDIMPQVQVDTGAIKFIMGGANCMSPGLTSPGGRIDDSIQKGALVAVMAEGKQHAMAIGTMSKSGTEVISENKGVAIEIVHYLNDGLWTLEWPSS